MRLSGKVALVTGAARGIGAEISRVLAAEGAAVLLTDIDGDAVTNTAAQLRAGGARVAGRALDVGSEPQWEAAVYAASDDFGGLSIVVNNAAIERQTFFADCTLEEFERIQRINVTGTFLGIKHAIRAMRPGGPSGQGGSIINMSSVAGLSGAPGSGAYSTSKGAVRLMTKAAAVECARLGYGIRVNSVHPGFVETEMYHEIMRRYVELGMFPDVNTAAAMVRQTHPLGLGRPSDIAQAVLYLAADESRWTTGAELVVDGGLHAS